MPNALPVLLLAALPAADPVSAPRVEGPSTETYGAQFKVRGISGGAGVRWYVSPRPEGIRTWQFPGAHTVIIAGPPGRYTVTAEVMVGRIGKLDRPLAEFKEGDEVPLVFELVAEVTKDFVLTGAPGPRPPPPGPDPPPPDPRPGGPVKFLVVVEETADAAHNRGAFFTDPALLARLKEKGIRARVADRDAVDAGGRPPADVRRFIDRARGHPLARVFLVDEAGRELFAGNMPDTPARLLELLAKYGG